MSAGYPAVRARVKAPFTPEQVRCLNGYQRAGLMHPFTCVHREDEAHRDTPNGGELVATTEGWTCPHCDYTQNWAHGFMVDAGWADFARCDDC